MKRKLNSTSRALEPFPKTDADIHRLVHELQVHQIELEQQNEELRRAREEIESGFVYTDLYDFAPVGYFILTCDGTVRQANLTGASMLGVERARLVGGQLKLFVVGRDLSAFNIFLNKVFESEEKNTIETELLKSNKESLWVKIEATAKPDGQTCRVVVIDITARRQAESQREVVFESLRIQYDLIKFLSICEDLNKALEYVLNTALQFEGIDCGGIYLANPMDGSLDLVVHSGLSHEFVKTASHYLADSPHVEMVRGGKIIYGHYEGIRPESGDWRQHEGLRALAIIPVLHQKQLLIILNFASHTYDIIPEKTQKNIEMFGLQIGSTLARLRSDAKTRESQRNLQTLFDSIDDLLFVLDGNGNIQKVNDVVCERLGYCNEELEGQNVLMVHPPERRSEVQMIIADMLAGKRDSCLIPVQAKNGLLIPVETKVTSGIWDGKPALFGISRDITERKRAEMLLIASESKLRAILNNSSDAIGVHINGIWEMCNPAAVRLFAVSSPDELIGTSILNVIALDERTRIRDFVRNRGAGTDAPLAYETRGLRSDGTEFDMDVTLSTFILEDIQHNLVILRDITERKQMESQRESIHQALLESETRYRNLADSIDEIFFALDQNLKLTFWNKASEALTGIQAANAIGKSIYEVFSDNPETRQTAMMYLDAFQTQHSRIFIQQNKIAGRDYCFEMSVYPSDGELSVMMKDINESKKEEVALLLESEARFRAIANYTFDWENWVGTDRALLWVNPAVERITGYTPEEYMLMPDRFGQIFLDEDRENILYHLEQGLKYGLSYNNLESRIQRKDGSIIWVGISYQPIYSVQGENIGLRSSIRDINDQKKLQTQIIKARDFYLTLFENFPALIWRAGTDAKCNYFNQAWLEFTGRKLEDELGDGWTDGVHPEDFNHCLEVYMAAFKARLPFEMEYRLRSENGQYRWILDNGKPYHDLSEEFSGYIGVCYDITQRKESEDSLLRLIKIEQMIARIAKRFIVIDPEKIDEEIIETLLDIAAITKPENIYIVMHSRDQNFVNKVYQIDTQSATGSVENRNIPINNHKWVSNLLAKNEPISITVSPELLNAENWIVKYLLSNDFKSLLIIPISHDGDLIGSIVLASHRAENTWSQEDINLLSLIANMISNVFIHIRSQESITRQITTHQRDLSVLYKVATTASELLDKNTLLDKILEILFEAVQCEAIVIYLIDQNLDLHLEANRVRMDDSAAFYRNFPASRDILGKLLKSLKPIVVENIPVDWHNLKGQGKSLGVLLPPSEESQYPTVSCLGVPILVRDELLGIVCLFTQPKKIFSAEEIALGSATANHLGLALKTIDLVQRANKLTVENERAKMARDLHDSVTQSLYSLMLFSNAAQDAAKNSNMEKLDTCLARISEQSLLASKHLRLLLYELNQDFFEQEGLLKAITYRLNAVERRLGIDAQLKVDILSPLPKPMEWDLFFFVNEALTNALKHAQATNIHILIQSNNEEVEVNVSDNGTGFDVDAVVEQGMGLISMRERAAHMGGELFIRSELKKGTEVCIKVRH